MQSVIGIDVSKGKSEGQAFLEKNRPLGTSFDIEHTQKGLEEFLARLGEMERLTGEKPRVILEATGHYHEPLTQFLSEKGYTVFLVNPLSSQRARKSKLRQVKTDAKDAWYLGELYYKEEFAPYLRQSELLLNLRSLSRTHEAITSMYVQLKLNFHAVLDQVFPLFAELFGDLFSVTSLVLLDAYSSPDAVIRAGEEEIAAKISALNHRSKSVAWSREKAKQLTVAAQNSPVLSVLEGHVFALKLQIKMLLEHQEHLQRLESEIDALAQRMEDYDLLRSIPGVGNKIAATILSEIGDIDRFDHPKKLVAYAGIDPSVYASGQFTSSTNPITKRGSKRLRRALFLAVQCGLRRKSNQRLSQYYAKKRIEGKPYKVAVIACANKLLHMIFALLKRGETYRAP